MTRSTFLYDLHLDLELSSHIRSCLFCVLCFYSMPSLVFFIVDGFFWCARFSLSLSLCPMNCRACFKSFFECLMNLLQNVLIIFLIFFSAVFLFIGIVVVVVFCHYFIVFVSFIRLNRTFWIICIWMWMDNNKK